MTEPTHESCAVALQRLRKLHNLSIARLDTESGVGVRSLSRFERGENFPGVRTICKLAEVYNVTPGTLLDDLLGIPPS